MAQRVQITLVDDTDGGPADETVRFALDGVQYEIDLSTANAATLRESLRQWAAQGRRLRRDRVGRAASVPPSTSQRRATPDEIRQWGRKNGFKVSDRGRVAQAVQDAFYQAQAS